MTEAQQEFRFTAPGRHIVDEDYIELTSVGVDIGSSTSHLAFSRLELQREGTRYTVAKRTMLYESDILLTPYIAGTTIDSATLGDFIATEYKAAGFTHDSVDTGALILTGHAVLRDNARAVAELFAAQAGRFVAVSAGDNLEAVMAAHGSGAAALSRQEERTVLNLDLGGGTTKLAICREGKVDQTAAIDVGARLIAYDAENVIVRLEECGRRICAELGMGLKIGDRVTTEQLETLVEYLADRLFEVVHRVQLPAVTEALLRTPPLTDKGNIDTIVFSGGVSEFIYGRETGRFGDLGPLLAAAVVARVQAMEVPVEQATAGIRATVIGASQYTIQVSGNTIFVSSLDALPVRNIPVVMPPFPFGRDEIEPGQIDQVVREALRRSDQHKAERPVALTLRWEGSATYQRIHAICRGILDGMAGHLASGHPLVLVCDRDIGGLLGLHIQEEMPISSPIISIDGVELGEFDFIDIGAIIPSSGAVPVVIKSLVFPSEVQ